MKNIFSLIAIVFLLMISSCGTSNSSSSTTYVNPHAQKHSEAHQNFAMDQAAKKLEEDFLKGVEGRYLGNIPCEDCEAIKYEIQLNKNYSYTLKLLYINKSEEVVSKEGFYTITENYLILLDKNGGEMKYLEKFNDNILLLDINSPEDHKETSMGYELIKIL